MDRHNSNHNARKNLIFDTITDLLLEEGLNGITYAKISSRCHLHINTIAYYFDGKDDMIQQCFRHIVEEDRKHLPEYYFRIPDNMSPVKALCLVIDHIIDHGQQMSEIRRVLNMYLLPNSNLSPKIREFMQQIDREALEIEYQAIVRYREAGILEESRIRQAFADISFMSAGCCVFKFFGVQCVDYDLAVSSARERIKRALLKDGLYPEN